MTIKKSPSKSHRNECFAAMNGAKCSILRVERCVGHCAFRKTAVELADEQAAVFERLASLPIEQQLHIADTYYDGKHPWIKEVTDDCVE